MNDALKRASRLCDRARGHRLIDGDLAGEALGHPEIDEDLRPVVHDGNRRRGRDVISYIDGDDPDHPLEGATISRRFRSSSAVFSASSAACSAISESRTSTAVTARAVLRLR